jgi:hypothetical protein
VTSKKIIYKTDVIIPKDAVSSYLHHTMQLFICKQKTEKFLGKLIFYQTLMHMSLQNHFFDDKILCISIRKSRHGAFTAVRRQALKKQRCSRMRRAEHKH